MLLTQLIVCMSVDQVSNVVCAHPLMASVVCLTPLSTTCGCPLLRHLSNRVQSACTCHLLLSSRTRHSCHLSPHSSKCARSARLGPPLLDTLGTTSVSITQPSYGHSNFLMSVRPGKMCPTLSLRSAPKPVLSSANDVLLLDAYVSVCPVNCCGRLV